MYFRNAQAYAAGRYRLWADPAFIAECARVRAAFEAERG